MTSSSQPGGFAGCHAPWVSFDPLPLVDYEIVLAVGNQVYVHENPIKPTMRESKPLRGVILPTKQLLVTISIPEAMTTLHEHLCKSETRVHLTFRGLYDFTEVARAVFQVRLVQSVLRDWVSQVQPSAGSDPRTLDPSAVWVDRGAKDHLKLFISQHLTIERVLDGLDIDSKQAKALHDDVLTRALAFFDQLRPLSLRELVMMDDTLAIYTRENGILEARPDIVKNVIKHLEEARQFRSRAQKAFRVISDMFRLRELNHKTHHDLYDRLKVDGSLDMIVLPVFGAAAKLKLDKDYHEISDEDLRQVNESRDYFLNESQWSTDIEEASAKKLDGSLESDKTIPKGLRLYRVSVVDIAQRTGSVGRVIQIGATRTITLDTPLPLRVEADPEPCQAPGDAEINELTRLVKSQAERLARLEQSQAERLTRLEQSQAEKTALGSVEERYPATVVAQRSLVAVPGMAVEVEGHNLPALLEFWTQSVSSSGPVVAKLLCDGETVYWQMIPSDKHESYVGFKMSHLMPRLHAGRHHISVAFEGLGQTVFVGQPNAAIRRLSVLEIPRR
jgi:hypothetical protein